MFKAYDVRGVYGSEVTEQNFYRLGIAENSVAKKIVLGMDYREKNAPLANAFLSGYSGETNYLGVMPTPVTAFFAREIEGVSLTASHNPPEYNGAKFLKKQRCYYTSELDQLKKQYSKITASHAGEFSDKLGKLEKKEISAYKDTLPRMGNAIYDLAGGAACAVKELFPSRMFDAPDPRFEKHGAEPKKETLQILAGETVKRKIPGFAFDGDADRVVACDAGKTIDGGILAAFIAQEHYKKNDKILITIDFTNEVCEFIRDELQMRASYSKIGDVHLLKAMEETRADFGAERSGHYSFARHMPYADGIYTAAKLSGTKPGEMAEFASQFTAVTLKEDSYVKIDFEKLADEVIDEAENVETIDGVKIEFGDYCLLIRRSQTEPKIRINSEAKDMENAKEGMRKARELVQKAKV